MVGNGVLAGIATFGEWEHSISGQYPEFIPVK
jgi:hypothetical protein